MLFLLLLLPIFVHSANIRSRPRGLGLLRLPSGSTDEKSAMMFPNLYIAGNKAGRRPQAVPDIHLPGQTGRFSGKTQFNPFTHMFSASYDDHNRDDWGFGYAVANANLLGLEVRKNYELYKELPDRRDDGMHQPFIHAFLVGADMDPKRFREFAGSLNLPIPGVNELFDLEGGLLMKNSRVVGDLDFPLNLSDPYERFPMSMSVIRETIDRNLQIGHTLPNVNLYMIDRETVMKHLVRNKPTATRSLPAIRKLPAMVVYKLHYFEELGGRVEPIRLLLAYGRIPYENVDIRREDWPKLKSNYPNAQIPILEEDGKILTQSIAIARYFAKKLNLLGGNDWEEAQADALVASVEDTVDALRPNEMIMKIVRGEAAELQEEITEALRPFLERLEKLLSTTNGQNLVGNRLTWADFVLADLYKRYCFAVPDLLNGFPKVNKFANCIYDLPGVKEHVAKRSIKNL